jgi:hypothetical protein
LGASSLLTRSHPDLATHPSVLVNHFIDHLYSFKGDLIHRMEIREAPEIDRAKDIPDQHA